MSYDGAGRLTSVIVPAGWQMRIETKGGASQSYNYDEQGNVTGICDGNGNETSYVLDSWGRITEIRKADGSKENYAYDFAGNITEVVDGNGNKRIYAYDDNNQLKFITYPDGSEEKYLYGIDGNLSKFQDRNGSTEHLPLRRQWSKNREK